MLKKIVLLLAATALAMLGATSHAQEARDFNIPPGELAPALEALAKQSGLDLIFQSDELKGIRTQGVRGNLTPREALHRLIEGTRLSIRTDSAGAILISTRPPAPATQEISTGETASGTEAATLEEVVVTASKRNETLQNVPASITALTDQKLTNLGVVDFQDYLPYVPGLSSNPGGEYGAPGIYNVILRGLNTGYVQQTATVGYYLDDIPLTPSASNSSSGQDAPDPALGDIERIEVLKGPQATLYGASTLGGLIKIVSRKPNLTRFSGDVRVGGVTVEDGGSGYSARGAVNVPLIQGTLAARLSAYDREDPGFTDNVLAGQSSINLDHAYGGRLILRYEPTDKLTFDLTGLIQKLHSLGNTQEFLNPRTLHPIYGYGRYSTLGNTTASTQLSVVGLSVNYDTDWGNLHQLLGIEHYFADYENLPITITLAPLLPMFGLTSPPINVGGNNRPQWKKTTDELRFTSIRMHHFEWQVGLFYTDEKVRRPFDLELVQFPSGVPLSAPLNPFLRTNTDGTYREYAGFGDLTYYFTEALDATVGTRYSHNEQQAVDTAAGLLGNPAGNVSQGFNASDESYLFDLRWRVSQQLSTYLRAASAYRPGGPQTVIAPGVPTRFGSDKDWDYEVGAKGGWFGGRLNTNLALYYIGSSGSRVGES
ncbi:MAG: TonB-dependent receptor domain-containing protein [Steroidobacteraceae bacterium]